MAGQLERTKTHERGSKLLQENCAHRDKSGGENTREMREDWNTKAVSMESLLKLVYSLSTRLRIRYIDRYRMCQDVGDCKLLAVSNKEK